METLFYGVVLTMLLVILAAPYLGIILLFVTVAFTETIPDLPFNASIFPILGAAIFLGFVIKAVQSKTPKFGLNSIYLIAGLFVLWIVVSNPSAALDDGDRNWFFTYTQLLMLTILTGELIDEKKKFHRLMFWFSLTLAISAIYGIFNTTIESTRMASEVESGLLGGKNTAARYYIVAALFAFYSQEYGQGLFKLINRILLVILLTGVLFTLSRSGLGLLVFAFFSIGVVKLKFSLRRSISLGIILILTYLILPGELFETYSSVLTGSEFETGGRGARYSSIESNIRFILWDSGIQMWKTSPFLGVGIGQYPYYVPYYLPFSLAHINLGAHNMFIQLLAETGVVGSALFLGILAAAFYSFSKRLGQKVDINLVWMIAFLVVVFGGIMKHDHYNKLLWLLIGGSAAIRHLYFNLETTIEKEQKARAALPH